MPKNKMFLVISLFFLFLVFMYFVKFRNVSENGINIRQINPYMGDIDITVSTTGIIEPQNRLEIKPSINGRVEEILVDEGDFVKKGSILAWMSSTERAALVDSAISQDNQLRQYWENVYKKTPIISPIDGKIIVRDFEPGQTITTSDSLVVLSDRLIVSAQFDETDIGYIQTGQEAVITLDAYPKNKIRGTVNHIAYESELVNNVTIYNVDILPHEVPDFFRSGMSANVEVIEKSRNNVLLVPVSAIIREGGENFVLVKDKKTNSVKKHRVEIGLTDLNNTEIISGLTTADIVIIKEKEYSITKQQTAGNPFMPSRKKN